MNKVSLIKSIHELQHALRLCGSADNRADNHLQEEKITMEKFIAVHSADGLSEGLINVELIEVIAELEYPTGVDDLLLHKGIKLAQMAFNSGVEWLKSKIVK